MWETKLRAQLEPVAKRYRRRQALYNIATIWALAFGATLLLIGLSALSGWWLGWLSPIVLVVAAAVGYRRWRAWCKVPSDWKELARLVEQSYPELNALLLTAVEQGVDRGGESRTESPIGRELIRQAYYEAKKRSWAGAISEGGLWRANLLHWGGLALFLGALIVLGRYAPSGAAVVPQGRLVEVLPGDVEIEAGEALSVIARFRPNDLPPEPILRVTSADGETREISLEKSMSDPVFSTTLSEISSPMDYRIGYGESESRAYHVDVYTLPSVEQVDAHLTYPDFTGKSSESIRDTHHITAVEGTSLRLDVKVSKPVSSAALVASDAKDGKIALEREEPDLYRSEWRLSERRRLEVRLKDEAGRTNPVATSVDIEVIENRPPQMELTFPSGDRQVSPLQEIVLEGEVWDDFGLKQYGVAFSQPGEETRYVTLGKKGSNKEKQQFDYLLALEGLQVKPSDVVNYFLWAEDVGPDGAERRTRGDIYFAEVRPFEERFREAPSTAGMSGQGQGGSQGGNLENLLEIQKKVIQATWNLMREVEANRGERGIGEKVAVIRKSQKDVIGGLSQAGGMPRVSGGGAVGVSETVEAARSALDALGRTKGGKKDREASLSKALGFEQEAYRGLLELQSREHRVARGGQRGGGSQGGAQGRRQLDALELKQSENLYETERQASAWESPEEEERREVIDELDALAQRQKDLNARLQELQTALEEATSEEEREKARRRLKRLREEERKALESLDEVRQRLAQNSSPESAKAEARLEQIRSRVEEAAEALSKEEVSQALASGTRAQRELEATREGLRQRAASQFEDALRSMRRQAREIVEEEEAIRELLSKATEKKASRLSGGPLEEAQKRLGSQAREVGRLLEQVRKTSQAAESPEPLLSDRLYEALRHAEQAEGAKEVLPWQLWQAWRDESKGSLENSLALSGELLKKGLLPMARQTEENGYQALLQLQQGIEDATEAVLGSDAEAMRTARRELESLSEQIEEEIKQASAAEGESPGTDSAEQNSPARESDEQETASAQRRGRDSDARSPSRLQEDSADNASDRVPDGAPGGSGTSLKELRERMEQELARLEESADYPMTGGGFREWSDRLRDVREMLPDEALRRRAGEVLEAARGIRRGLDQKTAGPDWPRIRTEILQPLVELQDRLGEELARQEDPKALPPLDRDPVPTEYSDLVRIYYERLGAESSQ